MSRRLLQAAARHRWPVLISGAVVVVVPFLIVQESGRASRPAIAVLFVVLAAFVFLFAVNLSGWDPDAGSVAADMVPDPLSQRLLTRWLRRSKHFRFVGGAAGLVTGLAFVSNGLGPMLVGLLGGIAIGGAAAELRNVRPDKGTTRNADMSARRLTDYASRIDTAALATLAATAVLMVGWGLTSSHGAAVTTATSGIAVLVTVGATAAMQWIVVNRRRPALPADLRRADDLMRRLAATHGFTRPAIAFAILLVVRGLEAFDDSTATTILTLALVALAIGWYVGSRQSRSNLLASAAA